MMMMRRRPSRRRRRLAAVAVCLASLAVAARGQPAAAQHLEGFCEASAAVALDAKHFAVAEDESNRLIVYRVGASKPALPPIQLSDFLHTGDKASDLEAAARIGDLVYWASSHSLTSNGSTREWRRRLFATQLDLTTSPPSLKPFGEPYIGLLSDLIAALSLKALRAAEITPEEPGGLNIEGLAGTPEGHLLLGFRNPLIEGKALLVPILNPDRVVARGATPIFGAFISIDLGGRGIRSIERVGAVYLILAGPTGNNGPFALFRWTGIATDDPVITNVVFPANFSPEALLVLPNADHALVLSDDGARCDPSSPRFQVLRIPLR